MRNAVTFSVSRNDPLVQSYVFCMENGCTSITMHTSFPKEYGRLFTLELVDPEGRCRFAKMLNEGDEVLQISEDVRKTSHGGIAGTIEAGKWILYCKAFAPYIPGDETKLLAVVIISDRQAEVKDHDDCSWMNPDARIFPHITETILNPRERWYRGDFHVHTTQSDGHERARNQSYRAKLMDLDFFWITEHNLMPGGWPASKVPVFPSTELTTQAGHMNLFGLKQVPSGLTNGMIMKDAEDGRDFLQHYISLAGKYHWFRSVNHPFLKPWAWEYQDMRMEDIDGLEVINDPTWMDNRSDNEKAIALMDRLWLDGWHITALGGSDTHALLSRWYQGADGPSIIGDPLTSVYMKGLSADHTVEALRKGHAIVSRFMKPAVTMNINGKDVLPGDEIREDGTLAVEIDFHELHEAVDLYCMLDGRKVPLSMYETGENHYRYEGTFRWQAGSFHVLRFGAEEEAHGTVFLTNPVWSGKGRRHFIFWKDAVYGL